MSLLGDGAALSTVGCSITPDLRRQAEDWEGSPGALWGASSPAWMVPVEGTRYQAVPACSAGSGRCEDIPAPPISSSLDAGTRRDADGDDNAGTQDGYHEDC